jgi:hypothetical protein
METDRPDPVRKQLSDHLLLRAAKFRGHARSDESWATACHVVAIACSLAVTVAAAVEAPKWLVISVSALSGAALVSNSVFGFERKAVWHRARKRKYDALVQQLTYEGATVEAVSRELREFEDDLGDKYPRFGSIENGKGS